MDQYLQAPYLVCMKDYIRRQAIKQSQSEVGGFLGRCRVLLQ